MRRDFILSKVGSKEKHFTFSVALTAIFLVLSNTHGFAQRDFNRQPKGNKPRVNFSLIQYRGGPSVIGIQPRSHLSRFVRNLIVALLTASGASRCGKCPTPSRTMR